uniref:Uncharacterized protein n=1 Tax=Mola mola TaxID=94237 RepID=A0A3Q4BJC4_MOLML
FIGGANGSEIKTNVLFPGEQLVYQIPNNTVLTSKIGLISSLRQFERVNSKVNHGQGLRGLKMEELIPATSHMDLRGREGGVLYPPGAYNPHIVSFFVYIQNPLLLKGGCAASMPHVSLLPLVSDSRTCRRRTLYSQLREDTVWSMESFNAYINDKFLVARCLPRDWVLGKHMQMIMTQCFLAVKSKLDRRLGFFDLIGCNLMVDEDFKVWLLHMNCNPALHTNCEVLKEVIPSIVVGTLDITLEIFDKCHLRRSFLPLSSQRDFVLLYYGINPADSVLACCRSNTSSEPNQRSSNRTQKPRYKSAAEDKTVLLTSPDYALNLLIRGEGRNGSEPGCWPNTSTVTPTSHLSFSSVISVTNKHPRPRHAGRVQAEQMHFTSYFLREGLSIHRSLEMNSPSSCCTSSMWEQMKEERILTGKSSGEDTGNARKKSLICAIKNLSLKHLDLIITGFVSLLKNIVVYFL